MPTDYIQVVTTIDRRDAAERIAHALVERRLAACVQVAGPITSVYRWQGKLETAQEWQCMAKTRQNLFAEVAETIRSLHSYDVPEILAMPITAGNAEYLDWMDGELKV